MMTLFKNLFTKSQESVPAKVLLDMEGMQERNAARIAQIKEEMGDKWILHKDHMKSRLDEPRPV
jgi:hypothetical protein